MRRSSVPTVFCAAVVLAAALGCDVGRKSPARPDGPSSGASAPAPAVPPSEEAAPFLSVAAGRDATCGVTANAALYCWGRNALGQLGDGTTNDSATPLPVLGACQ